MRRADGTFFSAFFVCLTTPPPAFAVPSSVCNSNFVEAALGWSLEPTAPTVLYTPAAATSSASHALLEQSSSSPIRQGGTGVLERAHAGRKPFKGANGAAHSQEANFIDDEESDDSSLSDSSLFDDVGRIRNDQKVPSAAAYRNNAYAGDGFNVYREAGSSRKNWEGRAKGNRSGDEGHYAECSSLTLAAGGEVVSGDDMGSDFDSDFESANGFEDDGMEINSVGIGGLRHDDLRRCIYYNCRHVLQRCHHHLDPFSNLSVGS